MLHHDVIVSVAGATSVLLACFRFPEDATEDAKRSRMRLGVRTAGMVLWPLVLNAVLGAGRYCDCRWVPVLWNMALWAMDLSIQTPIQMETSCVTAMAFGLCSWLGLKPGDDTSRIFMVAMLGYISIVQPRFEDDSQHAFVVRAVQSVVFAWCVGLVIAGICVGLKQSAT